MVAKPVRHEDQVVQAATTAFGELLVEMERLRDINKYLGDKLQDAHRHASDLQMQGSNAETRYDVLRGICLEFIAAHGWIEMAEKVQRMREVLGLDQEPVENRTYDYQTGWAEDGPVPDGEGDR